jgi:hypothetical protein
MGFCDGDPSPVDGRDLGFTFLASPTASLSVGMFLQAYGRRGIEDDAVGCYRVGVGAGDVQDVDVGFVVDKSR